MLCERCQERPATVYYTEVINNKQKKMQLCDVCAGQMHAGGLGFMPQMNLHHFLAGFLNQASNMQSMAPKAREGLTCSACGTQEGQLAQKGLFGCGDCYRLFKSRLEPLMRKIHGSSTHVGKVPERAGGRVRLVRQLEQHKAQLREAVAGEEFEKAAELRDKIRVMERQMQGGDEV